MTPPQFPRDAHQLGERVWVRDFDGSEKYLNRQEVNMNDLQTLLDSYHELQALKEEFVSVQSDRDRILEQRDALKAKLDKCVRVRAYQTHEGLWEAIQTEYPTHNNATLILDKPEGGE